MSIQHGSEEFKNLSRMLALASRDVSFRRTLKLYADRFHIFEDCEWLNVHWITMRSWIDNNGPTENVPSVHFIEGAHRVAEQLFPNQDVVWCDQWSKWMMSTDLSGLSRNHMANIMRAMCVNNAMMEYRTSQAQDSFDDCKKKFKEVEVARTIGLVPEDVCPFDDDAKVNLNLEKQKRTPMGIPFIDSAFAGGQLGGETALFLMPSGAGKTTLSLQACNCCVERELHVGYIPYEQPLKGDLMRRLLVLMSNATRDDWSVGNLNEVNPDVLARFHANKKRWSKFFHMFELWQRPGAMLSDVSQILDIARLARDEGNPFHLLILDWWGIIRAMLLAAARIKDAAEQRSFIAMQFRTMALGADELDLRIWLFHQMSGKTSSKKGAGTMFEGQEDTNMSNYFDLVCTSSKINKADSSIEFLIDKARMGAGGKVEQRLDGPRCRFTDPLNGSYRAAGGDLKAGDIDRINRSLAGEEDGDEEEFETE